MPKAKGGKRKSLSQEVSEDEGSKGAVEADFCFSQVGLAQSQEILPVKPAEQKKLENMKREDREKLLMDLSRLVLFKALAGEPIDRVQCMKQAGIDSKMGRISSAAFAEVHERLQNIFGFELRRLPRWMEKQKSIPKKCHNHYYVVTNVEDNEGMNNKLMHSVHTDSKVERGFLMFVLAVIACKGDVRSDGSRWLLVSDLYRLLNSLDENITADPPHQRDKKNKENRRHSITNRSEGQRCAPNPDMLLEKFVKMEYLLKEKVSDEKLAASQNADENSVVYCLGPRTAVEIGRKQILCFCAEVLDEEPDPAMLMEVEQDEQEEDDEIMED